ncbi:efflux RND transporter periplasmic adaptor subunit [Streptacidiphilus sp. EB129]|uniref:efflux RND transporter periplasmic adaptor subunit n=1 Tax=Streptacidiphilus sp. EB129 TaxID=3156262 RepID=UPI003518E89F
MKALPRRRRAVLLNSVLGLVLLSGAGVAYATVSDNGSSGSPTTARTATVAQGTVLATVSGSGSLFSPSDAGAGFTTGGTLTEVDVSPGQKVTAGQVLAKVDPTTANETLTAAQASLTAAQANLTNVESGQSSSSGGGNSGSGNGGSGGSGGGTSGGGSTGGTVPAASSTTRSQPSGKPTTQPTTAPTGTTPSPGASPSRHPRVAQPADGTQAATIAQPADYVQAAATPSATPTVNPAQLASAEQQVTSAQNAVATAQRAVDGTVLKAPVSGTVASVAGKVGQTVSGSGGGSGSGSASGSGSSSSSSASSTVPTGFVVITNPTGMEVTADFSEADALKLQAGQAATVTLNAQTSTVLNAKLLSISSLPVSSSGSGSSSSAVQYAAVLSITSDTSTLRTGLSTSVQVVTGEASNALYVPTAAITGTGSSSSVTLVLPDGSTRRQSVTVGVQGDTEVQITDGVTAGEKVQLTVVSSSGSGGFPGGGFPGGGGRTRTGGGGAGAGGFGGGGGGAKG